MMLHGVTEPNCKHQAFRTAALQVRMSPRPFLAQLLMNVAWVLPNVLQTPGSGIYLLQFCALDAAQT